MLDRGMDQAAGLRRMVQPAVPSLMAFPVTGSAASLWIAQLAHAMRAQGHKPVVIDAGRGALAGSFGLKLRHDLLDMMQGERQFDEVAQATADGVWVLRAERGVEAFVASGAPAQRLFSGFAGLSHGFDALLLAMPAAELACLASPAQAVPVLPLEPGEDALVRAYTTIKEMATGFGYSRFSIVTQGVANAQQARQAHARLASAVRSFLHCDVQLAGWLPRPPQDAAPALAELAQSLMHTAATPLVLH